VLDKLNFVYGANCVSVDAAGFLTVNTAGLSKAILSATQWLTDAINSTTYLATIQAVYDDTKVAFGELRRGGSSVFFNGLQRNADLIVLDFGDDRKVSGDQDAKDSYLNFILVHELSHGYSRTTDPAYQQETGGAVDAVNKIRFARHLLLRERYSSTKLTEKNLQIPFGSAAVQKNGSIRLNKQGGIKVKAETGKIIHWVATNVGGRGIN
jgi:hypothetical protein